MRRRELVAAACGAGLGLVLVGGFGPFVRHKAAEAARNFGAEIDVETVRPVWRGVALEGVRVSLADVPATRIRLGQVRVTLGGSGRTVGLYGGRIEAVGTRSELMRQVDAWRARRPAARTREGSKGGPGTRVELEGVDLAWRDRPEDPSESVFARDVAIEREGGRTQLSAAEAEVRMGALALAVTRGSVSVSRKGGATRLSALTAEAVEASWVLPEAAAKAEPGGDPAGAGGKAQVEPEPGGKGIPRQGGAAGGRADAGPWGRVERLRGALVAAAAGLHEALDEGAKVRLSGLRARLVRGSDALNLGPGIFEVRRGPAEIDLELAPEAGATSEGEALLFHLRVPVGADASSREIVADVRGGPIGFAALGIKEGDFGLVDVGKTTLSTRSHVVISADGRRFRVDGEGRVQRLSLKNRALAEDPVLGLELAWRARAELDAEARALRVEDGEADLGAIRVLGRGALETGGAGFRLEGSFEIPQTGCQAMLDSVPSGLVPKLRGMRMAGSYGVKVKARIDTERLDRDFLLDFDVANSCRITEAPPDVHVERFSRPFRRMAYTPEGEPYDLDAGPGTPGWASLRAISHFMPAAVLTTEDGGFPSHGGFSEEAIRNSVRENLRAKRFVRGASTISMQLAKNLYLERGKTLSRKLQEAVLTMYLEQELTKDQMMELYLNVVEFGPMVYGVGPAASHYFQTSASELSLSQALYLASIMPNPKKQHFGPGGEVTPGWTSYLRKLMAIAERRRRITPEELEAGLEETVVFGGPPRREASVDSDAAGDALPDAPLDAAGAPDPRPSPAVR